MKRETWTSITIILGGIAILLVCWDLIALQNRVLGLEQQLGALSKSNTIEPEGGGRVKWKQISDGEFLVRDTGGNVVAKLRVVPSDRSTVLNEILLEKP